LGVFLRWTSDEPVTLDGTEGLVTGAAVVIAWTAVENWHDASQEADAAATYGLLLVSGASVLLASGAILTATRTGARDSSERPPPPRPSP
jgi:hypothetical protein